MTIPKPEDMPAGAQSVDWARTLEAAQSTLSRAYQSGKLKGTRVGYRTLIHTKEDILEWLGLSIEPQVAPHPVERFVLRGLKSRAAVKRMARVST